MINELNFSQRTFLAAPTKSAPFGFVFLTFATTSSANDIVKSFTNERKRGASKILVSSLRKAIFAKTDKSPRCVSLPPQRF